MTWRLVSAACSERPRWRLTTRVDLMTPAKGLRRPKMFSVRHFGRRILEECPEG